MSDPDRLSKTEMQLIYAMRNNPKFSLAVDRIVKTHLELSGSNGEDK